MKKLGVSALLRPAHLRPPAGQPSRWVLAPLPPLVRPNAEQMAGRRARQPGLIRAPPAGCRCSFEVSRCRAAPAAGPSLPPGRRSRPAAGLAACVYPGAGWGLGAGILFPPDPSGTSKRHAGLKGDLGVGVGRRRGELGVLQPSWPLGPLSCPTPRTRVLLSAYLCAICVVLGLLDPATGLQGDGFIGQNRLSSLAGPPLS